MHCGALFQMIEHISLFLRADPLVEYR